MADEKYTFEQARVRLEEIVTRVRSKDVSLETSIDLLEEGVRLANTCTELSDHAEWRTVADQAEAARDSADAELTVSAESGDGAPEVGPDDSDDGAPADETVDSEPEMNA